jgi:hypothetical protein
MFDVIVNDDFQLRAEVDQCKQVALHIEVTTWNKRVAKLMKELFVEVKESFRLEGFSLLYTTTPNPKFVKMIAGGESVDVRKLGDLDLEVIVWKLEE